MPFAGHTLSVQGCEDWFYWTAKLNTHVHNLWPIKNCLEKTQIIHCSQKIESYEFPNTCWAVDLNEKIAETISSLQRIVK